MVTIIKYISCFLRHNFTSFLSYSLHNDVKSNSTKSISTSRTTLRELPSTPGRLPLSFGSLLFRVWVVPRKRKSVSRCLTHGRVYGHFKLHLILKVSCEYIFSLLTFSFYQRKSKCSKWGFDTDGKMPSELIRISLRGVPRSFYQRKSKCNYKAFVAISSIIFLMNSSTGTAPMSPFFLERTATAPTSISLSPITSI